MRAGGKRVAAAIATMVTSLLGLSVDGAGAQSQPPDGSAVLAFDLTRALNTTFGGKQTVVPTCAPRFDPIPGWRNAFMVAVDGALTGSCSMAPDNPTAQAGGSADGALTGRYDAASGRIEFQMVVKTAQSFGDAGGSQTTTQTYDGSAPVIGPTVQGIASLHIVCAGNCQSGPNTPYDKTLDIPFEMTLYGVAPSGDEANAAGSETSDEGSGGSNGVLLLAGASLAVVAGAAALVQRSRRGRPTAAPMPLAGDGPTDAAESKPMVIAAVGSDRAGGHEDDLEFGESAGVASPAASKAYEALVVGSESSPARGDAGEEPEANIDDSDPEDDDASGELRPRRGRRGDVGEGR